VVVHSKWLSDNEVKMYLKNPESIDDIMEDYKITAFKIRDRQSTMRDRPRGPRSQFTYDSYNSISMRQCRTILAEEGLLERVDAFIQKMPGDAGIKARIDWEYATEVDKSYPLFSILVSEFGLTKEQVNDMFIRAKSI